MSTLPVRYTNNHHVAPSKTAQPIVVAVNKAALAGCVQSAYHHRHQQQKHVQQYHHHQATPPVKRHPTKMAAARRAKSRSRSRAKGGSGTSTTGSGSPAKRRNGKAAPKKKMAQLMDVQQQQQQPEQEQQAGEQQTQNLLTAHDMVLEVAGRGAANGEAVCGGSEDGRTTLVVNEWSATLVGGDVLRTPDAAATCDRLQSIAATEEQTANVTDNEKAFVVADQQQHQQQPELQHNDHLMDTSEAMEEDSCALPSTSSQTSSGAMTGGEVAEPLVTPRRNNEELFAELQEALALEPKYQPSLFLPHSSQDGEITIGARDGAAHVLRCLKVWYELPTDVLFTAINLVDRFLAKMKVRPKHLACISVGSLFLAAEQLTGTKMNTEDLALISQCRCTAGDLERMAGIIANKLGVQPGTAPVTALTFIRLFYHLFRNAAYELGLHEFYEKSISLAELEQRIEVLACDANCSSIRPCELALVLICTQMDSHASGVVNQQISGLVDYAIEVQKLARIPDQTFFQSHAAVVAILARYNSSQHKMPYKQRLVWKLSSRTMRVLRPSNKMTSYLPTIDEQHQANFDQFSRYRTGSTSSEDDEDWPTSPVVPVFEELS